ncbi:MAG: NUDIX hydrolase [Clostridia bacterium]|nr:NUDIX hydrolase [Clostridia bacterium]
MNGKLRNMTAIYLLKDDKILLLYRQGGKVINNAWIGSAGGHFEDYELNDAEACVLREMKEEIGIIPENIEALSLRYVTLRRTKGEIRQNYYFFANLKSNVDENLTSNKGICKWFSIGEICNLEMPYTAGYVMKHYCEIGRFTSEMYVGISNGDKVEFVKMPEF